MNTETNQASAAPQAQPPATPPAEAPVVEEELVELKILKPMAGTDFSWRPNSVQSVPKSRALRLIKAGLAKKADEADKAAQAARVQTETARADFQKRAEQAEDNWRKTKAIVEEKTAELDLTKAELKALALRFGQLEKDNRTLVDRGASQEAEIRRLNEAAEGLRDQASEAEAQAKAAVAAQETALANLDETRAALEAANQAGDDLQGRVDKLTEEVANRDRTIGQLEKKAAASSKKPR